MGHKKRQLSGLKSKYNQDYSQEGKKKWKGKEKKMTTIAHQ
jgi:hypothetical protein